MSSKVRKLTLSYPFSIDNRQQRSVYSIEDVVMGGKRIHTIEERYDEYHKKIKYLICVSDGASLKQWKEIVPDGCTIEIEYFVS